MNKLLILLTALTTVLVVSCRKEIEYKGESDEPLIVVNNIMESDSVIRVHVEQSRFFLAPDGNPSDFWITDATVTLTVVGTGQVLTQNTVDADGDYVFPITALAGETYTLTVSHPDFNTVTSQTTVPFPVAILSVDTSSINDPNMGFLKRALVNFNDPAGKDYYVMKVSYKDNNSDTIYPNQYLGSNDASVVDIYGDDPGGEGYSYYQQLFFTDDFFDGQNKTLEIRTYSYVFNTDDRLQIHLYRCTEDTYKYLLSTLKSQYANGDIFSEPVKVYSNITDGYGIFGALAETVFLK